MPLLQRIIEHFQNLVLVSDTTMLLMGLSIIIMSIAYFYCAVIKKNHYDKIMLIIGMVIRILMLIGFTIEFSHQKAIYDGNILIDDKFRAIEQISNYLFYGFIFVAGIYDIYTIGINKFRGFFHTFDLAMMSIPILYGLTALILNFKLDEDTLTGFIIILSLMLLPYMFFKLYWKQNLKWYVIFFAYIAANLIIYKILRMKIVFAATLISYFLLGMYEVARILFSKVRNKLQGSTWNNLKITSIIFPAALIYSCIIALNITPLQIDKIYNIDSVYKENATFTSLKEAENIARVAVEDYKSNIKLWTPTTENFNNEYMFSIGDYSVRIDGPTGKIVDIRNKNFKPMKTDKVLNEEDIKKKTLDWLSRIGFIYDEKQFDLRIEKQSDKYIVKICGKFNDGSIDNSEAREIQWCFDGHLYAAFPGVYNIKAYKEVKIDEPLISKKIDEWYKKLGEKTPTYRVYDFKYWFGERKPSISLLCNNYDRFEMSPETGEIISFDRDTNRSSRAEDIKMTDEDYDKFNAKAEEFAKDFSSEWNKINYKLVKNSSKGNGYYLFEADTGIQIMSLSIKLDAQGKLASFQESSYSWSKLYRDREFKISSSTALSLVSKKFAPLGIYTKRAKLAVEINENGKVNYKWMIMVIPVKNAEHQIYYVDTDSGKITSLLDYK